MKDVGGLPLRSTAPSSTNIVMILSLEQQELVPNCCCILSIQQPDSLTSRDYKAASQNLIRSRFKSLFITYQARDLLEITAARAQKAFWRALKVTAGVKFFHWRSGTRTEHQDSGMFQSYLLVFRCYWEINRMGGKKYRHTGTHASYSRSGRDRLFLSMFICSPTQRMRSCEHALVYSQWGFDRHSHSIP